MGGRAPRRLFIGGFPTLGDLAEPGDSRVCVLAKRPIARGEISEGATPRVGFEGRKSGTGTQLWAEAAAQVGAGWIDGPCVYSGSRKLKVNGERKVVYPAYRLGVKQACRRRAVCDLEGSSTYVAAAIYAQINLPSLDHPPKLRGLSRFRGESAPWL